ncbi:Uncharacterised protein [Mycobacteroides abscessus subsp. massiliense]|nr:Uncharacterised protein [Mycobacteroides abscessus]SKL22723.1 Uncharacterised protein [Mycobacteroides abscessus subsp. massiliense]
MPREMPNARTATTATDKSSTGGICHARVISHADKPASPRPLPSAKTPNITAIASRAGRTCSANSQWRKGSEVRGMPGLHCENFIGCGKYRSPMAH